MKIAITTAGDSMASAIDSRFGRAPKFYIFDVETGSSEVIDNQQSLNAVQGAGIQAAQTIVRQNVDYLITGHCGPKAFRVLSAAGVKIVTTEAATVQEAIDLFKAGKLVPSESADVEGHWV